MTTEAAPPAEDAALTEARWNLDPLVDGGGDDAVRALFDETAADAEKFAETYRGKVAGLDAAGLAEAMRTLAEIGDRVGRAGSYAALAFSVDTLDPERGALLQEVQERGAVIETTLLFFDLEWTELDEERAEELLASSPSLISAATTCGRRAATARTCSPSRRRRSSPRRASPGARRSGACSPS